MPRISKRKLRRGLKNLRRINWLVKKVIKPRTIGRENEDRFLRIMEAYLANGHRGTPWMQGIERGSIRQDWEGIDFVVQSDIGDLFLQIKSSAGGKRIFEDEVRKRLVQGRRFPITRVVVVHPKLSDAQVRRAAVHELRDLYETVQGHGSNYVERREIG